MQRSHVSPHLNHSAAEEDGSLFLRGDWTAASAGQVTFLQDTTRRESPAARGTRRASLGWVRVRDRAACREQPHRHDDDTYQSVVEAAALFMDKPTSEMTEMQIID